MTSLDFFFKGVSPINRRVINLRMPKQSPSHPSHEPDAMDAVDDMSHHLDGINFKRLENFAVLTEAMKEKHLNNKNPLQESVKEHAVDIMAYEQLMRRAVLSDREADQLEEILEKASHNNILSFWLSLVDDRVLSEQGLLSQEAIEQYEKQQLTLRKNSKLFCKNITPDFD